MQDTSSQRPANQHESVLIKLFQNAFPRKTISSLLPRDACIIVIEIIKTHVTEKTDLLQEKKNRYPLLSLIAGDLRFEASPLIIALLHEIIGETLQ
ncbi:hypothetical protein GF339_21430 [candidate division KSB3 bacterium]|uniref:Uncharacterized protein n=1 Tax=candidate division KSB3 bacterium TaxID=2044937 RepID=A0A9D5Q8B6_9BACT|nr:hypothetical protein [candidate division KSB3 bacterium]MBD3327162.1 hypothetical protein [candidate division KSB3 bacterium]